MRLRYWLATAGWILMTALACGQTNQQPADPQSTGAQPANSQPANSQPANPKPIKPSAVAAAASASRLAHQSAPPSKVIRNHDLTDGSNPPEAADSAPTPNDTAAQVARDKATQEEERKVEQFERQGKTFQNQVKVQKGKIIDLQNRVQSLSEQFDAWSVSHRHVNPAVCWTSQHDTEFYKSWCDIGRNLKDATDASQRQLGQEKARLEQMQENIRRAGYGNAVYDPD
jgi:hypothetical protein